MVGNREGTRMKRDDPTYDDLIFKYIVIAMELGISERNLRRRLKQRNLHLPKWDGMVFIAKPHVTLLWNALFSPSC